MQDVYIVIDGVIGFSLVALSVVSLLKLGYKNPINRLFSFFSILVALWIIFNHMSGNVNLPKDVALVSNYVTFSTSFGVAILLMQFVVMLASARRLAKVIKYALAPLWVICVLCFTPMMVSNVIIQSNTYAVVSGQLMWLYAAGLVFMMSVVFYGIMHGLKYSSGAKRRQLKAISIGLVISLPLILSIDFIIPMTTGIFEITEFGITPLIILVASIYYGVVRYSLFDIKLAAVRAVAYVLSLVALSGVYFGIAYVSSVILFNGDISSSISINPINIILALLLAFIFQPIKRLFDKITNHFFYKDAYNTDDFFEKLNKILGFTTDLRGLLERTATEIAHTLKGEQAMFFINTDEVHFVAAGTEGHKHIPKADVDRFADAPINKNGVIVASLMEDSDQIKRMMISHRIELALPLIQDGKTLGYLFLGDHLTSNYTNRDIKVLNTISNELIIAIRNALAVQEIREFNITLQQRIANATRELRASNAQLRHLDKAKDEFLSMASHQLRTPLTSVKGYISMIMDGDVGRVSGDQKKLLGEAFNNSERMVGLINDFLSVSRIQTGRFVIDKVPIDLSLVVEQEVDSLRANANARQMELVYNKPDDCPIMDIDEGKIRQVIMNFIDNAIYYSHPNTKINIDLSVTKGEVLFTVNDTGIGVPKSERDQLFTKFYRASNAKKTRPDGTGVGLFLAKKVVDGHDGDVIFDSVEGKGSTFGFKLPIKPLISVAPAID
jgi:signal transduction histidine kinase